MDTITFLIVVSDSKISVASATLALIWRSHIDLSLVSPFPSTTTANSIQTLQTGDTHAFNSHGYYCVVRRHEFISLPFQCISSGTSAEYVLVDQSCFFNFSTTKRMYCLNIKHGYGRPSPWIRRMRYSSTSKTTLRSNVWPFCTITTCTCPIFSWHSWTHSI